MTEGTPRKPPRKRTRKAPTPKPKKVSTESRAALSQRWALSFEGQMRRFDGSAHSEMRPEPVEGQHEGASTGSAAHFG